MYKIIIWIGCAALGWAAVIVLSPFIWWLITEFAHAVREVLR